MIIDHARASLFEERLLSATLEVVPSAIKSQSAVFDIVHPQPTVLGQFWKISIEADKPQFEVKKAANCKKPTIAHFRKNIDAICHIIISF